MGQKIQLKDKDGNLQYPVTSTALVVDAEGKTAEQRLQELAGGISQSAADQKYAKKAIEEFDQPLTFVIADGILGTDDEYYFIPAKAQSRAKDSQILATKADIKALQIQVQELLDRLTNAGL